MVWQGSETQFNFDPMQCSFICHIWCNLVLRKVEINIRGFRWSSGHLIKKILPIKESTVSVRADDVTRIRCANKNWLGGFCIEDTVHWFLQSKISSVAWLTKRWKLPCRLLQRRHGGGSLPEESEAVLWAIWWSGSSQDDQVSPISSHSVFHLFPFQPRAWEEEVAGCEGSEGCEAVDGVCESAPDGDEQQCDNCQHVNGSCPSKQGAGPSSAWLWLWTSLYSATNDKLADQSIGWFWENMSDRCHRPLSNTMIASFFWQLRFFYRNCWPAKTIVIVAQQTVSSFRNMRPPLLSSHPPLFWSVSSSSAGSLVKRQQRDSCIFPSISPPHSPMSFPSLVHPPFLSSTTPTLPSSSPRNSKYQQQAVVPKQWNCSVGA